MAKVVKFKFSLGDTVYFLNNNKVNTGVIKEAKCSVFDHGVEICYYIEMGNPSLRIIEEEYCFASKAKLLKSL